MSAHSYPAADLTPLDPTRTHYARRRYRGHAREECLGAWSADGRWEYVRWEDTGTTWGLRWHHPDLGPLGLDHPGVWATLDDARYDSHTDEGRVLAELLAQAEAITGQRGAIPAARARAGQAALLLERAPAYQRWRAATRTCEVPG